MNSVVHVIAQNISSVEKLPIMHFLYELYSHSCTLTVLGLCKSHTQQQPICFLLFHACTLVTIDWEFSSDTLIIFSHYFTFDVAYNVNEHCVLIIFHERRNSNILYRKFANYSSQFV